MLDQPIARHGSALCPWLGYSFGVAPSSSVVDRPLALTTHQQLRCYHQVLAPRHTHTLLSLLTVALFRRRETGFSLEVSFGSSLLKTKALYKVVFSSPVLVIIGGYFPSNEFLFRCGSGD
ncbi:hypothetical protein F2Q69_00062287 [Brassica cretica]|uniref:Uncharacterized protein n=1 Tax=Brassica cretica TaxID=69181 RepID=A0A8S9RCF9_BRACR|nr:hypothetical protein F2Q69_00062287 [Brassica cretica]